MPLSPGAVLPKDMDQRQWARWNREQAITADDNTVATATIQDGAVATDKLADSAVTYAKMQDATADTVLGRLSTDGAISELTASDVVGLVEGETWSFSGNVGFFGATAVAQQSTFATVVLAPISGSADDTSFNDNFNTIKNALNAIKTALDNLGLTA